MYREGVPHVPAGPGRTGFDFSREGVRLTVEGWGGGSGAIGYIVGRALFGKSSWNGLSIAITVPAVSSRAVR